MLNIETKHLHLIQQILRNHLSKFNQKVVVWAFGSRVQETARKYSDLDLAIQFSEDIFLQEQEDDERIQTHEGYATNKMLLIINLKEAFEESELPYTVDILNYAKASPTFKKIIDEKKERILF